MKRMAGTALGIAGCRVLGAARSLLPAARADLSGQLGAEAPGDDAALGEVYLELIRHLRAHALHMLQSPCGVQPDRGRGTSCRDASMPRMRVTAQCSGWVELHLRQHLRSDLVIVGPAELHELRHAAPLQRAQLAADVPAGRMPVRVRDALDHRLPKSGSTCALQMLPCSPEIFWHADPWAHALLARRYLAEALHPQRCPLLTVSP